MSNFHQTGRPVAHGRASSSAGAALNFRERSLLRGLANGIVLSTMAWAAVGYLTFALR